MLKLDCITNKKINFNVFKFLILIMYKTKVMMEYIVDQ